ncbi:MAG: lipoyl synthase [Holophagaceae bacterium]|nr:lipoyl synthase [Holophagaceae bacterium]
MNRNTANHHARLPEWIAKEKITLAGLHAMKRGLRESQLYTVCEEARCPNRLQCFTQGTATFLLLGDNCTRNCSFCSINHGIPLQPNPNEPSEIATRVVSMGIKYVVLTSVTRDDLPDGGATHFATTICAIKEIGAKVEVLVPDFQGNLEAVARVVSAQPVVFNHNLETIPSLYAKIRPGADYDRSLAVLAEAKRIGNCLFGSSFRTKSGLMLGFGETDEQLLAVFQDLAKADTDILTLGQYLRPTRKQLPVHKYIHPDRFLELANLAQEQGIKKVYAGSFVRSSFNAGVIDEEISNRK